MGQVGEPSFPQYTFLEVLGQGSYGAVLKCSAGEDGSESASLRVCAVKCFRRGNRDRQGFRLALREARMLRALRHPNIVRLLDAFKSPSGRPYLVLEYVPRCAALELDRHPEGLPRRELQLLTWQLVHVMRHLHEICVVHRDIKPANILMTAEGVLKLCDFGFARSTLNAVSAAAAFSGPRSQHAASQCTSSHSQLAGSSALDDPMTSYVVTRWYRPPEVLLGMEYGAAADIWALGCTVAELATGEPLMPGSSSLDQLWRICRVLGPLPPHMMQRLTSHPDLEHLAMQLPPRGRSLRERLQGRASPRLIELVEECLRLDPRERPTAEELLTMPYFFEVPELIHGTVLEKLYDRHGRPGEGWLEAAPAVAVASSLRTDMLPVRDGMGAAAATAAAATAAATAVVAVGPATGADRGAPAASVDVMHGGPGAAAAVGHAAGMVPPLTAAAAADIGMPAGPSTAPMRVATSGYLTTGVAAAGEQAGGELGGERPTAAAADVIMRRRSAPWELLPVGAGGGVVGAAAVAGGGAAACSSVPNSIRMPASGGLCPPQRQLQPPRAAQQHRVGATLANAHALEAAAAAAAAADADGGRSSDRSSPVRLRSSLTGVLAVVGDHQDPPLYSRGTTPGRGLLSLANVASSSSVGHVSHAVTRIGCTSVPLSGGDGYVGCGMEEGDEEIPPADRQVHDSAYRGPAAALAARLRRQPAEPKARTTAATSGDMRPDPHAARVQQQQQPLKPGGFCGVFSCFCPATPGSPPSREQPYIVTSHGTMETASTMQVDASVRPGKQQQQPGGAQGPHPTVEHAEAPVERLSPGSLSTSQYQDSSSIKVDPISPKGLPVQPLAH